MVVRRLPVLLFLLVALAACQHRVVPPADVADPVTVYIVDYGRHAGLALPEGGGRLTEWYWGDWNYFALESNSLGDGLQALFGSKGATLGRFTFQARNAAEVRAATDARTAQPLVVSRRAADALNAGLARRYARRRDTEIVQPDGRRFVRDGAAYSLSYNSTHMVRDWLRALGCHVTGSGVTANFVVVRQARD